MEANDDEKKNWGPNLVALNFFLLYYDLKQPVDHNIKLLTAQFIFVSLSFNCALTKKVKTKSICYNDQRKRVREKDARRPI